MTVPAAAANAECVPSAWAAEHLPVNVDPIPFLTCEGEGFSPVWAEWRQRLREDRWDKTAAAQACVLIKEFDNAANSPEGVHEGLVAYNALIRTREVAEVASALQNLEGLCVLGIIAAAYICGQATDSFMLGPLWGILQSGQAFEFFADGGWPIPALDIFKHRWGSDSDYPHRLHYTDYVWWALPNLLPYERSKLHAHYAGSDGEVPMLLISVLGRHVSFSLNAALSIAEVWRGTVSFVFHDARLYGTDAGDLPSYGRVLRGPVFEASMRYYRSGREGLEREEALLDFSYALAREDWKGAHLGSTLLGSSRADASRLPHIWVCADCGLPAGQALRDGLPSEAPIMHIFDTSWWLMGPKGSHSLMIARFRAMQRSRHDAFIPTTAFASAFVEYVSGVRLPAVWQGARYITRHYKPAPCFKRSPRRLRLMPSSKFSFEDISAMHAGGPEGYETLETLVGKDNIATFGGTKSWDIFQLHCVAGEMACNVVNIFLTMTEKVGWHYFTPRELAPQIIPHTSEPDLIGDFLAHDAALFLADQPEKVLFHELYAAGVPLFVPSVETLAWKLLLIEPLPEELMGWDWELLRGNGSWQPPDLRAARQRFAVEPFDLAEENAGHFKAWYWLQIADWANAPHVAVFEGVSDLLWKAAKADFVSMSNGMRDHYTVRLAISGHRFASALRTVLTAG